MEVAEMIGGMTVNEVMDRMSNLERDAWLLKKHKDFEKPSRSDYYLMAVRASIIRGGGGDVQLDDMKLKWEKPLSIHSQEDVEYATAMAKVAWFGRLGKVPNDRSD